MKNPNSSCMVVIVLGIILFFLARWITVSVPDGRLSVLSCIINGISVPVVKISDSVGGVYKGIKESFTSKADLEKKILKLEKEKNSLKFGNAQLKELVYKSEDLKKQSEFMSTIKFKNVPARILYHSPSSWFHSANINAGTTKGINSGMGVLNSDGLIGQVISVSKKSALISSLTDGASSVGGMVQRSRVRGLVQGDFSDTLLFTYLKSDADITVGDICVTSGDGHLIPEGIPIGIVRSIVEDKISDTKTAAVEPFVRFDKIENMFVAVGE